MGTYLYDLIDRLTWRSEMFEDSDCDLYGSVSLFENSLAGNFPVLGDHVLHSLHQHSSVMLKEAANRLSNSYRMSIQATKLGVMILEWIHNYRVSSKEAVGLLQCNNNIAGVIYRFSIVFKKLGFW
jgi:hypothetical protein